MSDREQHGSLTISLDFEKYWGMRDKKEINQYKENLINVDEVVEKTLDLFEQYNIRATWATVGFLYYDKLDDLKGCLPEVLPDYQIQQLNPYPYLSGLSNNRELDVYHLGKQSLDRIIRAKGQELATHTFSHLYFLENGITREAGKQDLLTAITESKKMGQSIESIVFPRNQYDESTLSILKELGIRVYRGNEESWLYKASKDKEQSHVKRGLRLLDAVFNIVGHQTSQPKMANGLINVPSSRFLRPITQNGLFDRLHFRRIKQSMHYAAKNCTTYHLWWHPHNFGANMANNFARLERLLQYYQTLDEKYGFKSLNMQDFSDKL